MLIAERGSIMYLTQLFLVATLGYSLCFRVFENVVFQKTNEITTVHAHWLITVVHDLKPYERFIEHISKDIDRVQSILDSVAGSYNKSNDFGYSATLLSLSQEVDLLREVHFGLSTSFQNYHSFKEIAYKKKPYSSDRPIFFISIRHCVRE